jgi:hypothetical protein
MITWYGQFQDYLNQLLANLPWGNLLQAGRKAITSLWNRMRNQGLYEVLAYESTLELLDVRGVKAHFHKRQKVRYLQDNIIAYQDQAWGDGEFLLNYRCVPGVAVDRYRFGHKTIILISLREVKPRGSVDEFQIERDIRQGFITALEQWETEISHPTRTLKIMVIFPRKRPPQQISLVEADRQRFQILGMENKKQLPDGRWEVGWETKQPKLNERYIMKWVW